MARSLNFTVDREPIDLTVGGEKFVAPALLAPAALAELLDMQGRMTEMFSTLQTGNGQPIPQGALDKILGFIGDIFDLIFGEAASGVKAESAVRFRARLLSKDKPFDLMREVMPAVVGLVEEYTDRPSQPSSPSSMLPGDGGTTSTAGQPSTVSIPTSSPLPVSAT